MRTLSTLVIAAGIVALSLTSASSPTDTTLPNVPPARVVVSTDETSEGEIVEMRNWHDTAVKPAPKPSVKKRGNGKGRDD